MTKMSSFYVGKKNKTKEPLRFSLLAFLKLDQRKLGGQMIIFILLCISKH